MLDVKAAEPNDGSTARLTRNWEDDPEGSTARNKYLLLLIFYGCIYGWAMEWLPWLKLKPHVRTASTFARVKKRSVLPRFELWPPVFQKSAIELQLKENYLNVKAQ